MADDDPDEEPTKSRGWLRIVVMAGGGLLILAGSLIAPQCCARGLDVRRDSFPEPGLVEEQVIDIATEQLKKSLAD